MKAGVLALQGAFREHCEVLDALGVGAVEVRTPEHLAGLDALFLPGGESTTMSRLVDTSGVGVPLRAAITDGLAVFATCAGLILLAETVLDGRADQEPFGVLDVTVRRNAYGRQRESFEAPISITGLSGGSFPGVFIRAPAIVALGRGVDTLARHGDDVVAVRAGPIWATTFHPELSGDLRLHRWFLDEVGST